MNSHRVTKQEDMLDATLRNCLKNWTTSIDPPPFGKEYLLSAAMHQSRSVKVNKTFIFPRFILSELGAAFVRWNQSPEVEFSSNRHHQSFLDFGFNFGSSMNFF
jgi:hypothetical protein